MRGPEGDDDSHISVSPDFPPEAGPSSMPKYSNGHTVNGSTNGITSVQSSTNGINKLGKSLVSKITLPGKSLYDDSCIDREEFVRLVIQSLRDVGYMYVPVFLYALFI